MCWHSVWPTRLPVATVPKWSKNKEKEKMQSTVDRLAERLVSTLKRFLFQLQSTPSADVFNRAFVACRRASASSSASVESRRVERARWHRM
jgi:hypothetical protein